jgi:uncharacterized membrane protein (UPF0127 family)
MERDVVGTRAGLSASCASRDPNQPPLSDSIMIVLRYLLAALAAVVLFAAPVAAQSPADRHLAVETSSGTHVFEVEVMRTRAELERGLMYRRQMKPDSGMLFDFKTPQNVSMWMKNTYLALDMLFIGQDGRVVSVKENAEPLSESIISSGGPVVGVLELNSGTAERIGVKVGDLVRHPMFGT